ncbi:unnamed protein product [Effrenium voratum]|nr:unnamed protein product [Effrenium voratum]
MAARASRPSRAMMLQSGVPEDYVDALLDDNYMAQLIAATAKQHRKREKQRDRQARLQKVILVFLLCQAVLGVVVALYKTFLQPDKVISAFVNMENIDMVLMMDTSNHMKERREQQRNVVLHFSKDMHEAMARQRDDTLEANVQRVEELKHNQTTRFSRFLSFFFNTNKPQDHTGLSGGRLRFATGIFNRQGEARRLIWPLERESFAVLGLGPFELGVWEPPRTFAHGNSELQQLPDLSKTSLCHVFAELGVCHIENCSFAHSVEELRATNKFFKTSMCKFYVMGQCRMGKYCRHAHDESELRAEPTLEELFPMQEPGLFPRSLLPSLEEAYSLRPRLRQEPNAEGSYQGHWPQRYFETEEPSRPWREFEFKLADGQLVPEAAVISL